MVEESFADLVKRLRHDRNMTQAQMAEAMGIELRAYAAYEYGERKDPGLAIIKKMIKGLNLEPSEVLGFPRKQAIPATIKTLLDANEKMGETLSELQKENQELKSKQISEPKVNPELLTAWRTLTPPQRKVVLQSMKNLAQLKKKDGRGKIG